MKSRVPLFLLGLVGLTPIAVTAACGGKVIGTDTGDPQTIAPSGAGANGNGAPGSTATPADPPSSSPLPPCPSDSTPLPVPNPPDPVVLPQCQKFCDRNFACLGCTYGTCMPNCLSDALSTRPSGAPYVAWMTCLLAHSPTCSAQPACDAEYCAYVRSASSPSAPLPPECH
jgi:hypothetical protein